MRNCELTETWCTDKLSFCAWTCLTQRAKVGVSLRTTQRVFLHLVSSALVFLPSGGHGRFQSWRRLSGYVFFYFPRRKLSLCSVFPFSSPTPS
jgi:hypothetical protein